MAASKKRIKKIVIVLALIIINAWFWGNAALQLYFYRIFASDDYQIFALNQVPEKISLPEADIDGENLHFYGFDVKMPFLKKTTVSNVYPSFIDGRLLSMVISIKENDKFAAYVLITGYPPSESDEDMTFMELERLTHYARPSDLSWWNLYGNWKLLPYLMLKSIGRPLYTGGYYDAYDIETPYVKGYLEEGDTGKSTIESFTFALDNRSYSIGIIERKGFYGLRNIIGSIKPSKDFNRSYDDMSALYRNNPGYPAEMLLLSMISIKGPVENYQKEYVLKWLEEQLERALSSDGGEEDRDYADMLRKEISDLKASMEKDN